MRFFEKFFEKSLILRAERLKFHKILMFFSKKVE